MSTVDVEQSTKEREDTSGYVKHPALPDYTCRMVDLGVYGAFDDAEHLSQLVSFV